MEILGKLKPWRDPCRVVVVYWPRLYQNQKKHNDNWYCISLCIKDRSKKVPPIFTKESIFHPHSNFPLLFEFDQLSAQALHRGEKWPHMFNLSALYNFVLHIRKMEAMVKNGLLSMLCKSLGTPFSDLSLILSTIWGGESRILKILSLLIVNGP